MRKLRINKEDYGQWIVALCTILWPVAACVYSLVVAMKNGYPVKSPLISLGVILALAIALYYPVMKSESICQFDLRGHGLDFNIRMVFGGFIMCLIALFHEVNHMVIYGYTNYIAMVLLGLWGAFFAITVILLVVLFGLSWND